MLCQLCGKNAHTAVDGTAEILFLNLHDAGNIRGTFPKVGVVALVLLNNGFYNLVQEGRIHAQQLAMPGSPAEQTAQNIASALVAGQNSIGNHEGGSTDVVGDDTQGNVHLDALTVGSAGQLGYFVGDVHDGVHIKQGIHILTHHGQTLQTHTGINILLSKLRVVALTVVVELGEDVVPDLHIAVAVTANGAVGLATAVLLTTVVVDLGAGAAGAGAVLPEVIGLAEAEDLLRGYAHFLVPDLEGLVIVLIDGGIQPVLVQAHHLGQKLPTPVDGLVLEVVTEGEVAQHFKVGAVTSSLANVFNIAGTDTLLAGADPMTRRLHLTGKVRLHGRHAGINQQQGCVILRNQREAGQAQMALALKERQKHFTQFIYAVRLGIHGYYLQRK